MKFCPMTRRMFLRGLGGYALSIPFLPSLAPRALAASNESSLRFAMIVGKLGRDMSQWYPNISDKDLQQVNGIYTRRLSEISNPISYCISDKFNPVLNKISLLRGLDCLSTQGNHNSSVPTTGSSVDPSNAVGFGYSIDSILEESKTFYPTLPALGALRTCPDVQKPYHEFASFSYTSKTTRGQLIDPEWNPLQVYNRILNPSAIQSSNQKNVRLANVTDLVLENFKNTMGSRAIAAEDKLRLDSYMSLLSDTHKQLMVPLEVCGIAQSPGSLGSLSEVHKAMMKIEVAALSCGITNIVMHSIAHAGDMADPLWHQYAHGGEYSINPSTGRSYLSEYCRYRMDLVAYFLNELDQIPDGSGTLLDNTLFIYGNEDGTGSHEHLDLPVIVGGAKGKLNTGHFIDYRPRPFKTLISREKQIVHAGRPYNQLLVTAFKAFGLDPSQYQKFGQQGFGRYDKPFVTAGDHYQQFLGAKTNDPLPFLYL